MDPLHSIVVTSHSLCALVVPTWSAEPNQKVGMQCVHKLANICRL